MPRHIPFSEKVQAVIGSLPPATLTSEQLNQIASQIPPVDISGKVDKVTGHSLVSDTEISKIHAAGSDNQDLSGKLDVTAFSGLTKITVGSTPPTAPNIGDLYIDTN